MQNNNNVFLALETGIYNGRSLQEVVDLTCKQLISIGSIDAINRANFLKKYLEIRSNTAFKKVMETTLHTIVAELRKNILKDVPFDVGFRIKSLISLWEKIEKFFKKGRDYSEILDILGLRIIITDLDNYKASELIAEVANSILDLAVIRKWSITPLTMNIEDFDSSKFPDKLIPTNNVKEEYIPYCKNYCKYPKANGYQSLHMNLMPNSKIHAEVQLRTWQQHDLCENLKNLRHQDYKKKEYEASTFTYNINRIKTITVGCTAKLLDPYGIINPKCPLGGEI